MAVKEHLSNDDVHATITRGLKDHEIETLVAGDEGYEESIKRWSEAAEKRAAAVLFPTTAEHVSAIVQVATASDIEFVVCCGRHSTGGASSIDHGIVIDLRKMNKVIVDEEKKTLKIGGGCTWADVDHEAARFGLATVGGTVNHTGVGGLILGGGYGWLSPRYGLAIDILISADVVTADGSILHCSSTSNEDLFWAIRGAGSSFAVVTSFELQAYPQPDPVWAGTLVFTPDKLAQLVEVANHHHRTAKEETMIFGYMCAPPIFTPMLMAVIFYNGTEQDGRNYFAPLLEIGPVMDMTRMMPYEEVNAMFNDAATFGDRKSSGASAITYPLDIALFQEVFDAYTRFTDENKSAGAEASIVLFSMIPYEKINSVPLESTAFGSRGEYYNAELLLRWKDPAFDLKARQFSKVMNARIRELGGSAKDKGTGNYANNIEYAIDPKRVFGVNTERLKALKTVYDPQNRFRKWHDILYEERVD